MAKFVERIEMTTENCVNCGMIFAVTADFQWRRRNDHKTFYCPAGHGQHYTGASEAQRLREQLEKERHRRQAETGRAEAIAQQRDRVVKSYNRIRDRVKNGVCPCCNRTFQNLMKHMESQHPEFGKHEMLRALRDTYGLTQSALADEIGISSAYISNYEREKPNVPEYASRAIESWIAEQG